jgi:peptide/nickel transport system permease protein
VSVPSDATTAVLSHGGGPARPPDERRVPGRWTIVARRFVSHRLGVAGLALLGALFALAFLGPQLSRWDHTERDFGAFLQAPSAEHPFGTTQTGGDVFALTLSGMQKSLVIGLLVGLLSTGIAAIVGSFAGLLGGRVERALMWVVDLLLVLPAFLVVAILSPALRDGTWLVLVVLLAAFLWMVTARIVRAMTISLREREYVLAARYMGVPRRTIVLRHILPNISSLLVVDATLNVGAAIITETGLSYFGLGVQPPDVSLGTVIADGTRSAVGYPWLFGFAGGLLVLIVLAVNLVGDALRDALDPSSGGAR